MSLSRAPLIAAFLRYAAGLRFRPLFFITGALFLLDLAVPDLLPFADELFLGLLTLLFGAWRRGHDKQDDVARGSRIIDAETAGNDPPHND